MTNSLENFFNGSYLCVGWSKYGSFYYKFKIKLKFLEIERNIQIDVGFEGFCQRETVHRQKISPSSVKLNIAAKSLPQALLGEPLKPFHHLSTTPTK